MLEGMGGGRMRGGMRVKMGEEGRMGVEREGWEARWRGEGRRMEER